MISLENFLFSLLIASTLTGLTTEAVKGVLKEYKKKYYSNTISGIVALIMGTGIGIGNIMLSNAGFTSQTIVYVIVLVFMSWLCAMVGYDKVIQAISQFKTKGEE